MTVLDSIPIALFLIFMVFILLGSVYVLIQLSSLIIRLLTERRRKVDVIQDSRADH